MNKLKKVNTDIVKLILILIILIGIPGIKLLSYFLFQYKVIGSVFDINQVYLLWTTLPLLTITYLYDIFIKRIKINKIDIFVYILIIITIISTIFSIDSLTALIGRYTRNEGLYSLLSYYMIFLNCKDFKSQRFINISVNTFFIVGVIQIIYSFLQVYSDFSFIKLYGNSHIASGLCGNPNFFGSYAVMLASLSTSLYLLSKKKIYLFLTMLYFFGLCICASMGPFLTYILVILFLSVYLLKTKKSSIKNFIYFIITLLLVYLLVGVFPYVINRIKDTKVINETPQDEIFDINKEISIITEKPKEADAGRVDIWLTSLKFSKDYLLIGVGPDNFGYIYPQKERYVDKAHNIYIQMLATTGIFSLVAYCSICLIIFIKGFKSKNIISIALWIAFIGYSIQGFANISVIDVAPYFFMIMGLFLSSDKLK